MLVIVKIHNYENSFIYHSSRVNRNQERMIEMILRKLHAYLYLRWRYLRTMSTLQWAFCILLLISVVPIHHMMFPTKYEKICVTVHSGDTYWSLCERYGNDEEVRNTMAVSKEENIKAGTDLNNLQSGTTIVIYRRVN